MLCQTIIDRTLEQIKSSCMNLIWFRLGRKGKIKFNFRFDLLSQKPRLGPPTACSHATLCTQISTFNVHEINATLPLISKKKKKKKDWIVLLLFKKKPKKLCGGHLTRTQKAAGPSEESMRNHPVMDCQKKKV